MITKYFTINTKITNINLDPSIKEMAIKTLTSNQYTNSLAAETNSLHPLHSQLIEAYFIIEKIAYLSIMETGIIMYQLRLLLSLLISKILCFLHHNNKHQFRSNIIYHNLDHGFKCKINWTLTMTRNHKNRMLFQLFLL